MSVLGGIAGMVGALGGYAVGEALNRWKVPVITYHRFRTDRDPWRGTSVRDFERHLRFISGRYLPMRFSELVATHERGGSCPPRSIVITVDDGYADFHDLALPLLRAFGIPATVFVTTGFVDRECWMWTDRIRRAVVSSTKEHLAVDIRSSTLEFPLGDSASRSRVADALGARAKSLSDAERLDLVARVEREAGVASPTEPERDYAPMTWDQIRRCCSDGIEIGAHTVSHPILATIDVPTQERELRDSRARIESEVQREVRTLAYPNGAEGDFGDDTKAVARRLGYRGAASTIYGFATPIDDPFEVRRMSARADFRGFRQVVSGWQRFGTH
jgi:peptidoglycan/xylan/chitin deacetylase (PgdA/CDA1 family)